MTVSTNVNIIPDVVFGKNMQTGALARDKYDQFFGSVTANGAIAKARAMTKL